MSRNEPKVKVQSLSFDGEEIRLIPVAQIVAGDNDRKDFDAVELAELAANIADNGLAQHPLVRPLADNLFEIVCGERRTRAMRDVLGWVEIPCRVRQLDDEKASAIMLAENTSRSDLNPIEEGASFRKRIERFGWTPKQVAEACGRSVALVNRRLTLSALCDDVAFFVKSETFPIGHAEAMVQPDRTLDFNRQRIALRLYNKGALPLARFQDIVRDLFEQQQKEDATSLFDLEALMSGRIESGFISPPTGANAVAGAPTTSLLPQVRYSSSDGVGDILDRYIADLLAAGHDMEAAAVGNVYTSLVAHNWTRVPAHALLPAISHRSPVKAVAHELLIH